MAVPEKTQEKKAACLWKSLQEARTDPDTCGSVLFFAGNGGSVCFRAGAGGRGSGSPDCGGIQRAADSGTGCNPDGGFYRNSALLKKRGSGQKSGQCYENYDAAPDF